MPAVLVEVFDFTLQVGFIKPSEILTITSYDKAAAPTDVGYKRKKGRKHWALRPQKPLRLIRDGEVEWFGILYLTPTRYTVTTRVNPH